MHIIDVLIVLLIAGSLLRGIELGLVRQLLSTLAFFAGLFAGVFLEPHVVRLAHTPETRLLITVGVTLGLAFAALSIGEIAGVALKRRLLLQRWLDRIDNAGGAIVAGISTVIIIWLSTVVVLTLPYPGLQAMFRDSAVVNLINNHLPPAPNIVADLGHFISPNGFPNVFIGGEPSSTPASLPTPTQLTAAVAHDRPSIVKIEGQGCGGIVEGSGFVVAGNLVATNAHVVAGITKPYVIDDNGQHQAVPIWFDPNLDFAVLRVNNLAGQPLQFDTGTIARGTQGGVLGYPGGGPFTADTAAVLEEFTAIGRNIYNQGQTSRDVYAIQANVVPGNSGGPLVDLNGNVIGVVFAASTTTNDMGYALSNSQIIHELQQAEASNRPVGTGSCAE
jgi:S1-C subfamily serine protease